MRGAPVSGLTRLEQARCACGASLAGIIDQLGEADRTPISPPMAIGDVSTGVAAAMAVGFSLLNRERSGEGQYIDTSLLEAALAYTLWESNEYWATGTAPRGLGTAHRLAAPYQVFATASGWIAIGAANQRNWEHLASALDRSDLLQNPKFATNADRMANLAELVETLTATLKTRTTEEWLQVLDEAGVPCGPVLTLDEVYQHPQVKARAMDSEVQHPIAGRIHAIGFPVKYSSTPGQMYRPAPVLGQHTNAMLESLGYSPEQRRQLENDGVVLDAHLEM